ncbi:class I SAM-dependent methyltransferase [Flavobacterium haoranii]|uniref:2-polyprenyl-3-methyl-5-hydroxy-6-metoxy-1,4-benzoquinol methylase n=1 Tax=Flavobacterium haoranii TaxID=683124 RepID=A0A1M6EMU6_9FLAO|nr:class I SAM-dependent methyltransferase [Flavobacterium haoranii]SHI86608.1 2-polyprenyl-3-methyl-5-hydroxy-6-metoxy-1,4-benzoquinol methylase [Flavobacterium haoranii]
MNFKENNIYINVKDFSVSGESFSLLQNEEGEILKTTPTPSLEKLPSYYESEDYISHTDGQRSLFEKIYQIVKRNAIQQKVKLIGKFSQKGQLLDIGAGTGDFLVAAKNDGWQTLGIEPNKNAKTLAENKGVNFADQLEVISDDSFDVITMWHVLEHVPNLEYQLKQLKRICKPGGIVIIAVPNYKSFDAQYYKEFWAAYDVPRHLWHFSKNGIQKLFAQKNFQLVKMKPMWFDSFYVSLLSEKYKNGKMNFIKGFLIGFYSNLSGIFKNEYSSHIYVFKNE